MFKSISEIVYSLNISCTPDDEIAKFLKIHWGSVNIVSKGKVTDASKLSKVVAKNSVGKIIGLATFAPNLELKSCELVSIDATIQGKGIGSELVKKVKEATKNIGCNKIWLVTTNDNIEAANFYIKNGFRLIDVHLNVLNKSRKLKPQIPKIGKNGIPLLDEWEFSISI